MCGLAGRFHPSGLRPDAAWRERADALLRHRGPDGHGAFADGHCELVHRRLALIDLSPTGAQPMGNEDGAVRMIFNGEIYNHPELRRWLLDRGHTLRGTADCEVLPHLYEEQGAGLVERLRGMFAFAIYDAAERRLLLVRDRFGIKPLYYTTTGGGCAFASEIKALLALPDMPRRLDRQACYDFLGLGYVPEPQTAFRDIRALPAGCLLEIDAGGARLHRYHRVAARPDPSLDRDRVVDDLAARLERSVRAQSVADVPVAALLSGGIDSSLVVAAHRRTLKAPIRTFNVRFPDAAFDETRFARAAATHAGADHETIEMPGGELGLDEVLRLLEHFDQPFADSSLLPTHRVARAVRERGFICTLSGDGGDEAFGGYTVFARLPWLLRLAGLPSALRRGLAFAGDRAGTWLPDLGRPIARAARVAEAGRDDVPALIAGLTTYVGETEKQALLRPEARDTLDPVSRLVEPLPHATLEGAVGRLTEYLFAVSLPSDMLRKVDMMTMLHGLEVRVPLLDEDVVDLGLSLPLPLKIAGGTGKVALRAVAERWLPAEVAGHRKQGFRIPLDRTLPAHAGARLQEILLAPGSATRGLLETAVVRHWIDLFARSQNGATSGEISREGLSQRIVFLLSLETWMSRHRLAW